MRTESTDVYTNNEVNKDHNAIVKFPHSHRMSILHLVYFR